MLESLATLRADHVGSLLRPSDLVELMIASGERGTSDLAAAQDAAITSAVARQEAIGMPVVTDGEFRRRTFQDSFSGVAGAEGLLGGGLAELPSGDELPAPGSRVPHAADLSGKSAKAPVTRPLALTRNLPLAEFRFAARLATAPVKVTVLSVDRLRERIDVEHSYTSPEAVMEEVVSVARRIVSELADAGCEYIQIDGPNYTRFADPDWRAELHAAGLDPMAELERAMQWDNAVIDGIDNVTFGMHLCRGNRRSMWHRSGTYDAIAERLFTGLRHQRLLLEYDTPRAGNFQPLRFLPTDKVAVLGLISSKLGQLEDSREIVRRIEEASQYAPLERLALSPQCGFGSNVQGNRLTAEEQWRKLELVVAVAEQVWT